MSALRPGVIRRNKRHLDSRVTWRGVDWLVEHLCCGRRSWLSAASLDSQKRPSRCKLRGAGLEPALHRPTPKGPAMIQIVIENREQVRRLLEQFDEQGREYHVTLFGLKDGRLEINLEPRPGKLKNLEEVKALVSATQWAQFRFLEGDVSDPAACQEACAGMDYVLHEAALGSVPLSMTNPLGSHQSNVTGFLHMLLAARDARVKRFVYASSSAIYGDDPGLPKMEEKVGRPLSPYAATKAINEVYANAFALAYGLPSVGLRYFNVFGPRQDPDGAYAAVIPKWIAALLKREPIYINGDGETSRDFCFIENRVGNGFHPLVTRMPGNAIVREGSFGTRGVGRILPQRTDIDENAAGFLARFFERPVLRGIGPETISAPRLAGGVSPGRTSGCSSPRL